MPLWQIYAGRATAINSSSHNQNWYQDCYLWGGSSAPTPPSPSLTALGHVGPEVNDHLVLGADVGVVCHGCAHAAPATEARLEAALLVVHAGADIFMAGSKELFCEHNAQRGVKPCRRAAHVHLLQAGSSFCTSNELKINLYTILRIYTMIHTLWALQSCRGSLGCTIGVEPLLPLQGWRSHNSLHNILTANNCSCTSQ